jgi:acyl-CoA thioester hydrolase
MQSLYTVEVSSAPHETRLRVRYAETDQMGVVHHANYLIWMEVARVDWCEARGFQYRDMEKEEGVFLAVVETSCRHLRPAHFDDRIRVRSVVEEANSRVAKFAYEIFRDQELLATGFTKHVYVDRQMRRSRLPERYRELFGMEKSLPVLIPPAAI